MITFALLLIGVVAVALVARAGSKVLLQEQIELPEPLPDSGEDGS